MIVNSTEGNSFETSVKYIKQTVPLDKDRKIKFPEFREFQNLSEHWQFRDGNSQTLVVREYVKAYAFHISLNQDDESFWWGHVYDKQVK